MAQSGVEGYLSGEVEHRLGAGRSEDTKASIVLAQNDLTKEKIYRTLVRDVACLLHNTGTVILNAMPSSSRSRLAST